MATHTAHHDAHGHKDELWTYWGVLVALMVLLIITIAVSFFHFGMANWIIALSIALVKAFLVVWFFMHVRHSRHIVWVLAGVGFFFLSILIGAVITDVYGRGFHDPAGREITGMEQLPGPFENLMKDDWPEPLTDASAPTSAVQQ